MKISPIIHTRLYNCDYNLVVKPVDISANDLDLIKKHIFYSNKSMDFLDGERWIVFDKGDYRIGGLVGFLNDICNHCDLSSDEKEKSEKLFRDSKGRSIYGFIGIVIKDLTPEDKAIIPTYDYLWKLFLENISPVFESSFPVSIDKDFGEYNIDSILSSDKSFDNPKECKLFFEKRIVYISTLSGDYELFKHLLNFDNKDFSFCSNVSRIGDISDSIFSIITTPENCYCELERAEEEERKAKEKAEREKEERKKAIEAEEEERRKEEEEEAEYRRKREEHKRRQEEARRKQEEAEEEERRKREEERKKAEAEEEAEYRRKREERKRRQEEARRKQEEAEEEERRKREEERKKAEAEEEDEYRKKREKRKINQKEEDDNWQKEFKLKQRERDDILGFDDCDSDCRQSRKNYGNSHSYVKNNNFSNSSYNYSINKDNSINKNYIENPRENPRRCVEDADKKEREKQGELERQKRFNWYNSKNASNGNVEDIEITKIVKIIPELIEYYLPNDYLRKEFVSKFKKAIFKGAESVKTVFRELLDILDSCGINIKF